MLLQASILVAIVPFVAASSEALQQRTTYAGQETQLTFFGYPDNCDDTGCYQDQTAYDCNGRGAKAGGDGTFNNPLSVAIKEGGAFERCQIGYTTYLQKFVIFDGLCARYDTDV